MFSLTFSLDQVKSAPPEVRHWAEGLMPILNVVVPPFDSADESFD